MNYKICIKNLKLLVMALTVLVLAAGPSMAVTYDLCATTGSVTIAGTPVPIWGYTLGATCSPGDATLPGPELRAEAGDTLTINLTNNLAEAVSFFVPGLRTAGPPPAGMFTAQAGPGGTVSYTFDLANKAGSYLYHSATNRIRTQVPMGLYGALVVDAAEDSAYPGVTYAQDKVLVFSEIDPALNINPAGFDGAKVVNWNPKYFLINGSAYPNMDPIAFGTGENVLLRMVNAGLDTVFSTLDGGLYADLIAEDGNRYPHPIKQYGIELPAGKTIDAMVNVTTPGSYALYDRGLLLTNGSATGGGMLTYLNAGPGAGIFQLSDASYSVGEGDGTLTVTVNRVGGSTGAVSVDYATADGSATAGEDYTAATNTLNFDEGVTSQTFDIEISDDGIYEGNEEFFVNLSNATGGATIGTPSSAVVTIIENDPGPGALQFSSATYTVNENDGNLPVTVDRVGGSDGEVSVDYTTTNGSATAGSDYTAASGTLSFDEGVTSQTFDIGIIDDDTYEGNETFTVTLSNPLGGATLGAPIIATVTIADDEDAPAVPPTAIDDTASVDSYKGNEPPTAVNINLLENDEAGTYPLNPNSVVITTGTTTQRGGSVVINGDGWVTFSPKKGFRGTDTFQYIVDDTEENTSNVATVRVNVL